MGKETPSIYEFIDTTMAECTRLAEFDTQLL